VTKWSWVKMNGYEERGGGVVGWGVLMRCSAVTPGIQMRGDKVHCGRQPLYSKTEEKERGGKRKANLVVLKKVHTFRIWKKQIKDGVLPASTNWVPSYQTNTLTKANKLHSEGRRLSTILGPNSN